VGGRQLLKLIPKLNISNNEVINIYKWGSIEADGIMIEKL